MPTHKLIPYTIKLREKKDPGEEVDRPGDYWDLTDLQSEHSDIDDYQSIIDLIEEELREVFLEPFENEDNQRTLNVDRWIRADDMRILGNMDSLSFSEGDINTENEIEYVTRDLDGRDENTLEGIIYAGIYGYAADFYNVDSGERDENAREVSDSEEIPFYFLIHVPDGHYRAFLVIERFGVRGAKGILESRIEQTLNDIDEDIKLEMQPITSDELLTRLQRAEAIKGFEVIKNGVPKATHERNSENLGGSNEVRSKVYISAGWGRTVENDQGMIDWILDNQEYPFAEIYEGEPDEISVEVVENNRQRKLSLTDDEIRMEQIVDPERVPLDDDTGHPVIRHLARDSRQFTNDILEKYDLDTIDQDPLLE
jgi:hypothetical protein